MSDDSIAGLTHCVKDDYRGKILAAIFWGEPDPAWRVAGNRDEGYVKMERDM
jgi:hypothetical protein